VVRFSGRSRSDIVSLSLQRVAWHCQCAPSIFVHLLHREQQLSLEEYDKGTIDLSISGPWAEH
jgi:hypothetical protein